MALKYKNNGAVAVALFLRHFRTKFCIEILIYYSTTNLTIKKYLNLPNFGQTIKHITGLQEQYIYISKKVKAENFFKIWLSWAIFNL